MLAYLVNHQKVILERKPAVASGQGFWGEVKKRINVHNMRPGRLNEDKEDILRRQ